MMINRHKHRTAFSLLELAIVMATIGIMIGGIWSYAASARQNTKVEQAVETVSTSADALRASYQGQSSISGGISTVLPLLAQTGALPNQLMRNTSSTCSGTSGNYADSPWGSPANDACGSLRYCAWSYGTTTSCATSGGPSQVQYFAIEFTELDYGSCLAVAERVSPNNPPGMVDVYINATSVTATGTGLPVAPAVAAAKCTSATPPSNTVDFVYTLRPPSH